ncbi:class I SAM-dependent methyltransferase [Alloalcanivorax profundimaris]|uniref:class I SAM-dependent methyltransferase n=1 Tax=Alloalcanivorax profundimaris TaxID=2735259 RepID=UPI00188802FA|nr:class I SAM-dependent methyltransferase [Alloalcanivorax profundimaris]MBF1801107.1 class I SAM-dependent methyltransferase [Alloalcanivorax profundimaris]MCQ6260745.1 class I SAM-dependent methyltransferase [Alcanivorax sp. MM125-6]
MSATESTNAFLEKAWSEKGPKLISGFSRPVYHNVMGLLRGRKYDKRAYGGMIRHTEAAMLTQWASQVPNGGVVVEIGCYGGLSTSYLLRGLKKKGGHIHAIDPFNSDLGKQEELTDNLVPLENKPTKALVAERLRRNGFDGMFELIEGYSQEAAARWDPSVKIDFLWIDGNHEQAYRDFKDFEPHLNPGARVAVHDAHPRYGYQAVVDDVKKIFAEGAWADLEHVKSIITGRKVG